MDLKRFHFHQINDEVWGCPARMRIWVSRAPAWGKFYRGKHCVLGNSEWGEGFEFHLSKLGHIFFSLFLKIFYLFTFRDKGREGEREGEKLQCARGTSICCSPHAHNWEPGPETEALPWWGIKPSSFWFAGWHSIHWATPAGAQTIITWNVKGTYLRKSRSKLWSIK